MEKKYYVIGNWKMNPGNLNEAKSTAKTLQRITPNSKYVETVICPPSVFLYTLQKEIKGKTKYGHQGIHYEAKGAFTTKISASMAASAGAKFGIIGHSEERREGVTDEMVSGSLKNCLKEGMTPVLCVGENERDQNGFYFNIIRQQIETALSNIPKTRYTDIIIAYEPVWAIGKDAKRPASANEFLEIKIYIQKVITDLSNRKTADEVSIIYGGSADDTNILPFLEAGAMGFLPGRASLEPEVFSKMVLEVIDFAKNEGSK
ncbi:triose-phosphate isomerase [Candidatus Nomurabacteria bacterium]|nr:triose-phosphate isomerase [Candidatus Nomurabacteria bacterium]